MGGQCSKNVAVDNVQVGQVKAEPEVPLSPKEQEILNGRLIEAARECDKHGMREWLKLGASPNFEKDGKTALMHMMESYHFRDRAQLLLDNKADINFQPICGFTALQIALMEKSFEDSDGFYKVKWLLDSGAKISDHDIEHALEYSTPGCVRLLRETDQKRKALALAEKNNALEQDFSGVKSVQMGSQVLGDLSTKPLLTQMTQMRRPISPGETATVQQRSDDIVENKSASLKI